MNFLNRLAIDDPVLTTTERNVLPSSIANSGDSAEQLLGRMRRAQLHDLLRSYALLTEKLEALPLPTLIRRISNMAEDGVFNKPPISRWHFERAKYNSDDVKAAKHNPEAPGYLPRIITDPYRGTRRTEYVPVPTLLPWVGDDESPKTAKPAKAKMPEHKSVMDDLRAKARQRGINSFGKSAAALAQEIEHGELMADATEKLIAGGKAETAA